MEEKKMRRRQVLELWLLWTAIAYVGIIVIDLMAILCVLSWPDVTLDNTFFEKMVISTLAYLVLVTIIKTIVYNMIEKIYGKKEKEAIEITI